jgi:hypothetical protein
MFVVGLLIVFLKTISTEFPTKIFLDACVKETLINKWDAIGNEISEGVHSLSWTSQDEESWWKIGVVVGEYQLG